MRPWKVRVLRVAAVLLLGIAALPLPVARGQAAKKQLAAVVNGTEIFLDELEGQFTLKQQIYDLKAELLQQLVVKKLIDLEAQKNGLTTEQLLFKEIEAKVGQPSDAAVYGFYLARRDTYGAPLERVRDQVVADLRDVEIQQARKEFGEKLRSTAKVTTLLERPRAPIEIGDAPKRGREGPAQVTIIEFGDYQCPYCRGVQATLHEVMAKYGDRVSFAFKDFPLREIHPEAQGAAEAAACAREQGHFWEYHDAMFTSPSLEPDALHGLAEELHLDTKRFDGCRASKKFNAHIDADIEQGAAMGMTGTPAFNINGLVLVGVQPLAEFERLIDQELLRKKQ